MYMVDRYQRYPYTSVYRNAISQQYGVVQHWGLCNVTRSSKNFIQRLERCSVLEGHSGCVNTLAWNSIGSLLLSGSDDYLLNIYDIFSEKMLHSIESGHRANIFSAKFLPCTSDMKIVSCSGDGMLHYNELGTSYGENFFNCHSGTTYEVLVTPGDPNTFLSCGEDGTVRLFDLRTKSKCHCQECSEDILIDTRHAVTSISINPMSPYHLAAGCKDSFVRVFDQRTLGTSVNTRSVNRNKGWMPGLFCTFKPEKLRKDASCRITSLRYSNDGKDILVSYCTDYVYTFSVGNDQGNILSTKESKSEKTFHTNGNKSTSFQDDDSDGLPPVKRLRLRGDWSDTGPQARPETLEENGPENNLMQRMSELFSRWLDDALNSPLERLEGENSIGSATSLEDIDGNRRTENQFVNNQQPNSSSDRDENSTSEGNLNSIEESSELNTNSCPPESSLDSVDENWMFFSTDDENNDMGNESNAGSRNDTKNYMDLYKTEELNVPKRSSTNNESPSVNVMDMEPCSSSRNNEIGADNTSNVNAICKGEFCPDFNDDQTSKPEYFFNDRIRSPDQRNSPTSCNNRDDGSYDKVDIELSSRSCSGDKLEYMHRSEDLNETTPLLSAKQPNKTSTGLSLNKRVTNKDCNHSAIGTKCTFSSCESVQSGLSKSDCGSISTTCILGDYQLPADEPLDSPNHSTGDRMSSRNSNESTLLVELKGESTDLVDNRDEDIHSVMNDGKVEGYITSDNFVTSDPRRRGDVLCVTEEQNNCLDTLVETGLNREREIVGTSNIESCEEPYDSDDDVGLPKKTIGNALLIVDNESQSNDGNQRNNNVEFQTTSNIAPAVSNSNEPQDIDNVTIGEEQLFQQGRSRTSTRVTDSEQRTVRLPHITQDFYDDIPTQERAAVRIQKFLRHHRSRHISVDDNFAHVRKAVFTPTKYTVFKGHRNARTMIKEANFWGDDYVLSGSDCGRIFIWDRHTTELVMLLQGDSHVVNCVQPHPFDPFLASSGIDHDIKLWAPLAEELPDLSDMGEIVNRNEQMLEESRDTITVPASFVLRMLASFGSMRRRRTSYQQMDPDENTDDNES